VPDSTKERGKKMSDDLDLASRKMQLLAELAQIELHEKEAAIRARDELRARIANAIRNAIAQLATTNESVFVVIKAEGDVEIKFDVTPRGSSSRVTRDERASSRVTDGRGVRVPVVLLSSSGAEKHYESAQAALVHGVGLDMAGKSGVREAGLANADIGKIVTGNDTKYILVREKPLSGISLAEALAAAKAMLRG